MGGVAKGAVGTLAVILALNAAPVLADDEMRMISIRGAGEVSARPDQARVSMAVLTQAETASEALSRNSERMRKVFTLLEQSGIAKTDVTTSALRLDPVYEQSNRQNRPPRPDGIPAILGYRATNQISVRLRDLDRLGHLLDQAVGEGANRLQGIRFEISEKTALADEARKRAVADARRKARLYAEAAGVTLGPVLSITEHGAHVPQPRVLRAFRAEAASDVPIAGGEQMVRAGVSITFALE